VTSTGAGSSRPRPSHGQLRRGIHAGIGAGIATFAVGVAFGLVARPVLGTLAAIVMSLVVFAGSAQLTAVSVLSAGGSAEAAIVAGLLMNLRFIPMGVAAASTFRGGPLRRAFEAQALVDASWAIAGDGTGRFDRGLLLGASIPQALGWWTGTAVGAIGGSQLAHVDALGLDAIFPAFFLLLLIDQVRDRRGLTAAVLGAAVCLLLIPHAPAGIPVAASAAGALIGLRPRRAAEARP
jgi:4-azaleucine resistance transporter AzlC